MNLSSQPQRIEYVDALRGFALFGILMVNSSAFASTYYGTGMSDPAFQSPLDQLVRWLITVIFESKFYVLFSFLFGYSFTLQLSSAERSGADLTPRFLRRLCGLFIIGCLHAVFLFQGDILTTYAILGLLLLLKREMKPGSAVRSGALLIMVAALFYAFLGVLSRFGMPEAPDIAAIHDIATRTTAGYRGSFTEVVTQRTSELPSVLFVVWFIQAPAAFAMFLFGLAAGKIRLIENIPQYTPLLRGFIVIGFTVGAAGSLLQSHRPSTELFELAVNAITSPLLSAAYGASLLLLVQSPYGQKIRARLGWAGRMALSNYLCQSLACSLVFTGYGLGLTGRLSPLAVVALVFAIFAAQLSMSRWWLQRYRYGPLEWLLRAITYASWPTMRAEVST